MPTTARQIFTAAIKAALQRGDKDAVARIELAREYCTNPAFRQALADHLWATRDAGVAS